MDDATALRVALDRHLIKPRASMWDALRDARAFGLAVPEELGGAGLSVSIAMVVVEALADQASVTPWLESQMLAPWLLLRERTPSGDAVLRAIANGATVGIAGLDPRLRTSLSATPTATGWRLDGDALLVLDGATADHLLVAARTETYSIALLLVAPLVDGLTCQRYPTIDGRDAADLRCINVAATLLSADVGDLLDEVGDLALVSLATEAAALMRRLVDDTVAYTKERRQFGHPIGTFQVMQHRLVDMYIQSRRATAIAARAVAALEGHWAERARLASAAKATVAEAGRFVGQNAVQLHGGMGMTDELAIGRMFKRLAVIEHELGGVDLHLVRVARMAAQQRAA